MALASACRPFPAAMSGNVSSFLRYGRTCTASQTRATWPSDMCGNIGSDSISAAAASATGSGPVGETPVRRLPMARDRVVDTGLDPHRREPLLNLRPSRAPVPPRGGRRPGPRPPRRPSGPRPPREARRGTARRPTGAPRSRRPAWRASRSAPPPGARRAGCWCRPARAGNASPPPGHGRAGT